MPLPQFSQQAQFDADGFVLVKQDISALCREAKGPHNNRSDRDAVDSHPIEAITELPASLTTLQTNIDVAQANSYAFTWINAC